MKKGSGTFGAPKPLPGQAGYNTSVSEQLEKESKEMEARLQQLQDKLQKQQLEDSSSGKSKWKSARVEKGGLGTYGKELEVKHKKKMESEGVNNDALLKGTASNRRTSRQATQGGNFKTKDVSSWSVSDVGEWLSFVMMDQYIEKFAENEINGLILLDITLDDLDYMGITVLGHRKVILKGAEDLRKNKRVSSLSASLPTGLGAMERTHSASNVMSESNNEGSGKLASTGSAKVTHWSNLEPLSSNKVSSGGTLVNAADEQDFLDEEAERLAFQEAVKAWRSEGTSEGSSGAGKGPAKVVIEREYLGGGGAGGKAMKSSNSVSSSSSSNGSATLAQASMEVLDEEAERRAFQQAVNEWRNAGNSKSSSNSNSVAASASATSAGSSTGKDDSMWHNPFASYSGGNTSSRSKLSSDLLNDSDDEKPAAVAAAASRSGAGKGPIANSLYDGVLDEAKEHEEFAKAVEMWRNGKSSSSAAGGSRSLADKLKQELEQEQLQSSHQLQKQKEEAEQRLRQASVELERMRQTAQRAAAEREKSEGKEAENSKKYDVKQQEEEGDFYVPKFTYSSVPTQRGKPGGYFESKRQDGDDDDVLSVASDEAPAGNVAVSVLETVLGISQGDHLEESCYVVEYDSD